MTTKQKRNIDFVKIVEKYPCLYDFTIPEYALRKIVEGTWHAVAHEAVLSVEGAKEKWKTLRAAYSRSLKNSPSAHTKRRKSHLYDAMQFLEPFMKNRISRGGQPSAHPEGRRKPQNDAVAFGRRFISDASSEEDEDRSVFARSLAAEGQVTSNRAPSFTSPETQHAETSAVDFVANQGPIIFSVGSVAAVQRQRENGDTPLQLSVTPFDADQVFFASLLPDLQKLTERRKRKFKRMTMELLDDMLNEQEDEMHEFKYISVNNVSCSNSMTDM